MVDEAKGPSGAQETTTTPTIAIACVAFVPGVLGGRTIGLAGPVPTSNVVKGIVAEVDTRLAHAIGVGLGLAAVPLGEETPTRATTVHDAAFAAIPSATVILLPPASHEVVAVEVVGAGEGRGPTSMDILHPVALAVLHEEATKAAAVPGMGRGAIAPTSGAFDTGLAERPGAGTTTSQASKEEARACATLLPGLAVPVVGVPAAMATDATTTTCPVAD